MEYALLPKFVQFELTYACNSSCAFCYNPSRKKQSDESVIINVLNELNRYRLDHVQLIGGEVTLFKDRLPYFLSLLNQVKVCSMVTNGRVFIPETIDYLDEVYISIHGDESMHESITRAENSFKSIQRTITEYVKSGIIVSSDTVLTRLNYKQMLEICKYASGLGMKNIFVNIFQSAGLGARKEDDLVPSLDEIRHAIGQLIEAKKTLPLNIHFGTSTPYCLDERLIENDMTFTCGTGSWFASINPWGDLRICNQSTKDYGNILQDDLGKIWHSQAIDDEYRNLDWLNVSEPCRSCVFKSDCLGGCRINDKGEARIDPIVIREQANLVPQARLNELFKQTERVRHYQIS